MKNAIIKIVCIAAILCVTNILFGQKKNLSFEQILRNQPHNITQDIPTTIEWNDENSYIEYTIDDDEKLVATLVNIKTGSREPYILKKDIVYIKDNDIFYANVLGDTIQLTKTEAVEKNPTLSPDNTQVAFTRDNNLYVIDLSSRKETQYTGDGSDVILNGYASWVYYEEILGRPSQYRAFWWSPNSKHIVFFRTNDSNVPVFPIYNSEGQHGYIENTRYPKAGDPNPEVKVGILSLNTGKIVWADFNEKDDQYFGQPFWAPNSESVWLQWMPREQNNLRIYSVDPKNGYKKQVYNEKQTTWVDWKNNISFLADGSGYLIQNDTDGWDHIYLYDMKGLKKQKLTTGNLWRTRIIKVDDKTKTVYYTSRGEKSTRTDFYSVKLSGKGQKRLTFGNYSHNVILSPDNKHFITTYSNAVTPTRIALCDVNKAAVVKELANAKGAEFENYNLATPKIEWLKTPEGFDIPGMITLPNNLDPNKKYPVLISIYGGPDAGTVSDVWKGINPSQWWANEGLIQIAIDHRGSGHCGKKGMNYLHRDLGKWEIADYIQWAKWLHTLPYVDKNKICITGGSYGGYVTSLALTVGADYFNYGIADFGVVDWMLYDSHYTERYMDAPKDNPEGYKSSSVFTYLDKYKSGEAMLRIQHGTTDDNVHLQHSLQLIKAMQNKNMNFETMFYPECRHGWKEMEMQWTHYKNEVARFYYRYLLEKQVPNAPLFQ